MRNWNNCSKTLIQLPENGAVLLPDGHRRSARHSSSLWAHKCVYLRRKTHTGSRALKCCSPWDACWVCRAVLQAASLGISGCDGGHRDIGTKAWVEEMSLSSSESLCHRAWQTIWGKSTRNAAAGHVIQQGKLLQSLKESWLAGRENLPVNC